MGLNVYYQFSLEICIHTHTYIHIYIEKEIDLCHSGKIRGRILPLKYNPPTFEYKIHSVEVDLYYFKYL